MDVFNYVTGATVQFTGALTLAIAGNAATTCVAIWATAATTVNGSLGDQCRYRFGTDADYIILDAEL
jgi:hypothetical protein